MEYTKLFPLQLLNREY